MNRKGKLLCTAIMAAQLVFHAGALAQPVERAAETYESGRLGARCSRSDSATRTLPDSSCSRTTCLSKRRHRRSHRSRRRNQRRSRRPNPPRNRRPNLPRNRRRSRRRRSRPSPRASRRRRSCRSRTTPAWRSGTKRTLKRISPRSWPSRSCRSSARRAADLDNTYARHGGISPRGGRGIYAERSLPHDRSGALGHPRGRRAVLRARGIRPSRAARPHALRLSELRGLL